MNRHRLLMASHFLLRFWLGGMLIFSGVEKLRAYLWWRDDILVKMALVPESLLAFSAAALPGIEVVTGAIVVAGIWKRAGGWMAFTLFGVFGLSLISVLVRGIDADCGCFGENSSYPVTWAGVARNGFFMVLAYLLTALPALTKKEPTCPR
jgi:hypothetical protein